MLKSAVARTAFAVAVSCAAFGLFTGCESEEHRADRLAEAKMQEVEKQQVAAGDMSQLDAVQSQYDQLANASSTLSPRMRILLRGHQAQVRFERVNLMLADLRAKELDIARTISDLEKMAVELTGTQASVAALESYDPSSQVDVIRAKQASIAGTGGDSSQSTLTLAKLQSTIDTLTAAIAKNGDDAKALKQSRDDATTKAETLSRQAEGEQGDQAALDTAQATKLRRDAGVADAQLDTLGSQLTHLQADMDAAKTQFAALQSASATLDIQVQAMQAGWTAIQQQIDAQRKLEQQIIGNDASANDPNSITIAQLAGQLNTLISDAATLRDTVSEQLDQTVSQYSQAGNDAETLRSKLLQQVNGPSAGPSAPILRETLDTLHPLYFNQQMAAAMEARAMVAAEKTEIEIMLAQMLDGFQITPSTTQPTDTPNKPVQIPGLLSLLSRDKTGMDMPQTVAQLHKSDADTMKQLKDDVDSKFQEALAAYDKRYGADNPASAQEHINVSLVGRALTNRQWAHYASLIGDDAAAHQHQTDADNDLGQIPAAMRNVNAPYVPPPAPVTPDNSGGNNTSAAQ